MDVHRTRRVVAAIVIALGAFGTAACTTWRIQGLSPAMVITRDQPRVIRITAIDSSHVVVDNPRLIGDTLTGTTGATPFRAPVSDVAYVSLRRGDAGKTAGLVLLGGVGALIGLAVLIAATW